MLFQHEISGVKGCCCLVRLKDGIQDVGLKDGDIEEKPSKHICLIEPVLELFFLEQAGELRIIILRRN
jgi:hypothetical protein